MSNVRKFALASRAIAPWFVGFSMLALAGTVAYYGEKVVTRYDRAEPLLMQFKGAANAFDKYLACENDAATEDCNPEKGLRGLINRTKQHF
ncbi:MAG TPA: hypothetical protein VIN59_09610, partial [Alphaproteobacteria bacterium]